MRLALPLVALCCLIPISACSPRDHLGHERPRSPAPPPVASPQPVAEGVDERPRSDGDSSPTTASGVPPESANPSAKLEGTPFDCGVGKTLVIQCGPPLAARPPHGEPPYQTCPKTEYVSPAFFMGRSIWSQQTRREPSPLNRSLTETYRAHRNGSDDCCYGSCVAVEARAHASPFPADRHHYRHQLECMTAIPGGAVHPAPGRADCPVAVDMDRGPDGHVAAFDGKSTAKRVEEARKDSGFEELELCCYNVAQRMMTRKMPRP